MLDSALDALLICYVLLQFMADVTMPQDILYRLEPFRADDSNEPVVPNGKEVWPMLFEFGSFRG